MYPKILKPFLNYSLAGFVLSIISLVFLLITVVLFFNKKRNVFFIQKKPSIKRPLFQIVKSKAINDIPCKKGSFLLGYTRFIFNGDAIRKTSQDELSQLIHVLKGEMSLEGPRTLLPAYLELYSPECTKRCDLKPGFSAGAQVNARNTLSEEEKFVFDVEYVGNLSAQLNIENLFLTLEKVLKRHGVNANNYFTMEAFKGISA